MGTTSERVGGRCVGWVQGLSLDTKVVANVRISHRHAVVKAAGNHVRLAEVDEQLPWHDLYDSLRDIDEQTYFDLCTPGAFRDPQYENPSTASDVTMTPIPVADESMPDAVAGEPDTSEIPVLPNSSVYAPVRNPRVRWRSDALELPTPQSALPAVSSQDVPAATSPWPRPICQSSMRRRRPNHLSLLTLIHNPKLHFQHPQLMNPCHVPTMMIHHHGSIKNPKHSGFLPSRIHQRSFHGKCRHHP